MKKTLILCLLAVLVGGLVLFTSKSGRFSTEGADQKTNSVRIPGTVESNQVVVSAQAAGRIQDLNAEEGSWIEANSVIATLDRDELMAQQRQQEAQIAQLEAKRKQAAELTSMQKDSTAEAVSRAAAQVEVVKSQRQQTATELAQQRKDLDRDKAMLDSAALPRQEYERQFTLVQSSEDKLRTLDNQIKAAEAELSAARANQRQATVTEQDVAQTDAQMKQVEAQLDQTRARIAYTTVKAPISGRVSLKVVSRGEYVRAGDPIATIVELDDIWVRAGVDENYLAGDLIGRAIPVELANGTKLEGKIAAVAPEGTFATQRDVDRVKRDIRAFDIKVRVPNSDRVVYPGMTAYIYLPPSGASAKDAAARRANPVTE